MSVTEIEDDDDFSALLAEKRHNEIYLALKNIASSLSSKGREEEIKSAIENQSKSVEKFVSAISNIEKKDFSVDIHQEQVVKSISEMGQNILAALEKVNASLNKKPAPKKWEFAVDIRSGMIEKITATEIQ